MAITLVKNVNFGRSLRGLATVGYTLINSVGGIASPRTATGVYEVGTLTGIYASQITFPTGFHGSILWDTGGDNPRYASEEYSPIEEQTQFNYDISGGRWKIANNIMIFYKEDNVTEITRFNLLDDTGSPTMDDVHERVKV